MNFALLFMLFCQAIKKAKAVTDKPSIIEVHTTIGWGSQNQGTEKVHGSPLSADDVKQLKKKLGLNPDEMFQVPEETKKVSSLSTYGVDSTCSKANLTGLRSCRAARTAFIYRRGTFKLLCCQSPSGNRALAMHAIFSFTPK